LKLKNYFKDSALAIFVRVKDLEVLEERLRHRNSDPEESIKKRLAKAAYEMTFEKEFDKVLISDQLESTLQTALNYVNDFIFPKKG